MTTGNVVEFRREPEEPAFDRTVVHQWGEDDPITGFWDGKPVPEGYIVVETHGDKLVIPEPPPYEQTDRGRLDALEAHSQRLERRLRLLERQGRP